jgi:hypothetical protein
MKYPYIKFELNVYNTYRDNERKLKISNFFSKFKRDNSVKNQQTITKFKLDLRIPMTNLHMQFESYTCIQTKAWERKLKISIFSKFKRDNSVKNQWTITKFKLDLRIPMSNLHMHFEPTLSRPVRIRVRIDPPHPLVCRKRRLNGAVLRMRLEKPRSRVTVGVAR